MLRHRLNPGAPQCVKAKSIQPSLSKSNATAPAVGAGISVLHGLVAVNLPSRGFSNTTGDFCQPVTTKSIARSLFTSLAIAPTDGPFPPSPVSLVHSVKVPFPLLRHRTFPGDAPFSGNAKGCDGSPSGKSPSRVTYK